MGHAQHPGQRAAAQRGDGHRHRVQAGDRDGAAGRHRHHPQEPLRRGAGVGSGPGQALGERDDRQPDHALAHQPDLRSARPDEEVPDFRRAHHGRRQQGRQARRDPDQPRPPFRDDARPADRGHHDPRPALYRAGRHDARAGARDPAPPQGRKAARRRRALPAEGAHHGQGHPEAGEIPERLQGLPRPPAGRRGDWRRQGRARARRGARRGARRCAGHRHRARTLPGRARHGPPHSPRVRGRRPDCRQHRDRRSGRGPDRPRRRWRQGRHRRRVDLHHARRRRHWRADDHGRRQLRARGRTSQACP